MLFWLVIYCSLCAFSYCRTYNDKCRCKDEKERDVDIRTCDKLEMHHDTSYTCFNTTQLPDFYMYGNATLDMTSYNLENSTFKIHIMPYSNSTILSTISLTDHIEFISNSTVYLSLIELDSNLTIPTNCSLTVLGVTRLFNSAQFHLSSFTSLYTLQDLVLNGNSQFIIHSNSTHYHDHSCFLYNTSKYQVDEFGFSYVKNQINMFEKSFVSLQNYSTMKVKGYFFNLYEYSKLFIGEYVALECLNLYSYLDSIITIGNYSNILTDNVYLFDNSNIHIHSNIKFDTSNYISLFATTHMTIESNTLLTAKSYFLLYNSSLTLHSNCNLTVGGFEMKAFSTLTVDSNSIITITGNHLSTACLKDHKTAYCYSLELLGASSITFTSSNINQPLINILYGEVKIWNTTTINTPNDNCVDLIWFEKLPKTLNGIEITSFCYLCDNHLIRYCPTETDPGCTTNEVTKCDFNNKVKTEL
ncbi:Uncharacterized protein QTN25_004747 [Entamoeba marina]